MKKLIFLVFFCFLGFTSFTQIYDPDFSKVIILVKNDAGEVQKYLDIILVRTDSNFQFPAITNSKGKAEFTVNRGFEYAIVFTDYQVNEKLKVPKQGQNFVTKTVIYNAPKRIVSDEYDTIDQRELILTDPTNTTAITEIRILNYNKMPILNFEVRLRCDAIKKVYMTATDSNGVAVFLVPIGQFYNIDLEKNNSWQRFKIPYKPGTVFTYDLIYVPTTLYENVINDTIIQTLPKNVEATVNRGYVHMLVLDESGNPMAGEEVIINKVGKDSLIYKAVTDSNGYADFLLPKGFKYELHFKYERNLDILDFTEKRTLHTKEIEYTYIKPPNYAIQSYYLPNSENLRLDDYRNYRIKNLPPIPKGQKVGLVADFGHKEFNVNMKEAVLRINYYAEPYIDQDIPPVNICLVVDKSGSMSGDKLVHLKNALNRYISTLRDDDILSLILFDDYPITVSPADKIKDNKEYLLEQIPKIDADNGTNILDGLVAGYEEVLKNYNKGRVNRVILMTDGFGVNLPDLVIEKSKEYNDKGLECSTLGIGYGFNHYLLSKLATNGMGLNLVARDANEIETVYYNDLMSVLSLIGTEVRLEVIYPDGLQIENAYGYEFEKGNNKINLKLDKIYGGLNQLLLMTFSTSKDFTEDEELEIKIRLTYTDVKSNEKKEVNTSALLELKEKPSIAFKDFQDELLRKQYIIAFLGQAMQEMAEEFEKGNPKEAHKIVKQAIKEVKIIYPNTPDEDIDRILAEFNNYLKTLEAATK